MKAGSLFLFLLICLEALPRNNEYDTTINGIQINTGLSSSIFPGFWRAPPVNAHGEKIEEIEAGRSIRVITAAMAKYPLPVLQQNLRSVYLLRSLICYNVEYGGTNSKDAIYLANDGIANGYTDQYLEQIFHHEFSSILLRNFPSFFKKAAWMKINNKEFRYEDPENGVGAIRNGQFSQQMDTNLCRTGMLTQYSLSSMENDVNTITQFLFCPTAKFREIANSYPRINKKIQLMIRFYHKINHHFTKKYFRSIPYNPNR